MGRALSGDAFWAAVRHDVNSYLGAVHGVALSEGLRAKVADRAGSVPQLYPPNPVAAAVLTTSGTSHTGGQGRSPSSAPRTMTD